VKLTMPRDVLAASTGWVTATARTGKTAHLPPVLAGLLLSAAEDGTLTIASYDYQTSALAQITAAETGEPGRVVLPARMLAQAAAMLPAGHEAVTITTDGTRAVIASGQVTYTLLTLPDDEFPALPEPGAPAAEFGAEHLAQAVTQAVTAAGGDDTLPALTCVRLALDGQGTATLAATDRYRLAVATCPYTPVGDAEPPGPVLIPARELAAITRKPSTATVTLHLPPASYPPILNPPGIAGFTADGRQVTTRLTDGEFPRYETLIPGEASASPVTATVTAGLAVLTDAVKRAEIVNPGKEHPVWLGVTQAGASIQAGTGDDAGYTEVIPVQLDGEPVRIAFKPRYLLDALAAIAATGADTVRIAITSPVKPALITPAEAGGPVTCRHVVMPVKSAG
jgi:DNA polymerase-3 subunit beta